MSLIILNFPSLVLKPLLHFPINAEQKKEIQGWKLSNVFYLSNFCAFSVFFKISDIASLSAFL